MSNLFSEMLKKLRTERGLSQTQLGDRLFVNQSTVARWESGTRLPDATIRGFMRPKEAIEYARMNHVALAVLDIELGILYYIDSLFPSILVPLLTFYLLHCCGEGLRGSRLFRIEAALWAGFFILLNTTPFTTWFYYILVTIHDLADSRLLILKQ